MEESKGPKSDKLGGFDLADELRRRAIKRKVYKERGRFGRLRHVAKAYGVLVGDCTRTQIRIKILLRSRGVQVEAGVYALEEREQWVRRLPEMARLHARFLFWEYDAQKALKKEAQKELIREARRHPEYRLVKTCPGMGPIRTAQLLPVVVTPYRSKLRELTDGRRCYVPVSELVETVNRQLRGWANYFRLGYPRPAYRILNAFAVNRLTIHLQRRSQRPCRPPAGMTYYQFLTRRLGLKLL